MSLTSALSNANTGLSAATRSAELISSNVANALTEGYGRKELRLSAAVVGGNGAGVRVSGVERVVNQVAINERRLSDAALGDAQKEATFFGRLEAVLGAPDSPNSLAGRIAALEASLVSASASPESSTQLGTVVSAAKNLTRSINTASDEIQKIRQSADQEIGQQVNLINGTLSSIADLNDQIRSQTVSGFDATGLMDQRQQLIDQISDLIPLKEIPRDHGRIALTTPNGTILVEDDAAQFGFTPTPTIVPEMTIGSGALSDLTLIGAASSAGTAISAIKGGALAASFELRDQTTVEAQADLDGLARDLIERTSDPAADPTLAGAVGLFTDAGVAFDLAEEVGLASRIAVNSRVDPNEGGEVWRIRDGIGSVSQGPTGDISILASLANSLSSGETSTSGFPISSLAGEYLSSIGASKFQAESNVSFAQGQVTAFGNAERSAGVDTDQEMQKLLSVEMSYAANAKVIETIDQMMQSLLRI